MTHPIHRVQSFGADFDPATLHDWPARAPAMLDMARQWKEPAGR